MPVSKQEFLWREWVLGESRYRGKGSRSSPRPDVGYGDSAKGQRPIPKVWWQRLEEFLARRDGAEIPGLVAPKRKPVTPADPFRLTPHFHTREFDCKDGRRVPAVAIPALDRLATMILEPLRDNFGLAVVMSGYRPRDYNARIGGASRSQHIYELTSDSVAADMVFARGRPRQWAAEANRLGAGGIGTYDSFVHVDNRPVRASWSG